MNPSFDHSSSRRNAERDIKRPQVLFHHGSAPATEQPTPMLPLAASAAVVNRTRRVVRREADDLRERRSRSRSLWVPLTICSTLLLVLCYAVWGMLNGYDVTPSGIPDASDQLLVLLIWSLPVTALLIGVAWLRRGRNRNQGEIR